jgi:hypothetical protein
MAVIRLLPEQKAIERSIENLQRKQNVLPNDHPQKNTNAAKITALQAKLK